MHSHLSKPPPPPPKNKQTEKKTLNYPCWPTLILSVWIWGFFFFSSFNLCLFTAHILHQTHAVHRVFHHTEVVIIIVTFIYDGPHYLWNADDSFLVIYFHCECHFVPILSGQRVMGSFESWSLIADVIIQQMFSGRKLRVDLAESSGGDRERGDNAGRSGQFAVVVTKLVFVTLFS